MATNAKTRPNSTAPQKAIWLTMSFLVSRRDQNERSPLQRGQLQSRPVLFWVRFRWNCHLKHFPGLCPQSELAPADRKCTLNFICRNDYGCSCHIVFGIQRKKPQCASIITANAPKNTIPGEHRCKNSLCTGWALRLTQAMLQGRFVCFPVLAHL